jgi:hypothetical protein
MTTTGAKPDGKHAGHENSMTYEAESIGSQFPLLR